MGREFVSKVVSKMTCRYPPPLHQLAASLILGYRGCDKAVGERILEGEPFTQSNND